ncbi:hypothetical protein [Prochlorococcus sp. MIT 1223]|uniref:hypothetical protein n=1 Tax=Prochlorococcus sp. MIT 1223 TaxID=3096217 RepID=UPI002A75F403|nr:hypothetical protein [Prochlorococcus sp. MIT 1223]
MATRREKYPEKCPWDGGPDQNLAKKDQWVMQNGIETVVFSKNKLDEHYFIIKTPQNEETILAFRARLLFQKLLDKGFKLQEF